MKISTVFRPCAIPGRPLRIAVAALVAINLLISAAFAQLEIAPPLFVAVDATGLSPGPLLSITNSGSLGGFFYARGGGTTVPVVAAVDGGGTVGISFDGGDYLQHVVSVGGALVPAPAGLVGINPTCTIEVWVLNGAIDRDECLLAWGKRGTTGANTAFNYGWDAAWGAVGHWGTPDIGWMSGVDGGGIYATNVPVAGVWHHLAYTFDGTTQRVYADGVLKNSEVVSLNVFSGPPIILAGQTDPDGTTVTATLRGSMTIGKVRIHDGVLTADQIATNYLLEVSGFTNGPGGLLLSGPTHRYGFNNAAGSAPAGSVISDAVGTANGSVAGSGGAFTGSRLTLPGGGSSGSAAYVALPAGLLSANSTNKGGSGEVTIEGWAKVTGNQNWSRLFDFGSSSGGSGQDYLQYSAQNGTDIRTRTLEVKNADAVGGTGGGGSLNHGTTTFGQDLYFAITWNDATGEMRIYENGSFVGRRTETARLNQLNDVNVWLGRSQYTSDPSLQGQFEEFRTYNRVLSDAELRGNFLRGPETVSAQLAMFNVTGGGTQCGGVPVGLSGSEAGVTYLLRSNGVVTAVAVNGDGSALSFGNQTGNGTYTVLASNTTTAVSALMSGRAVAIVAGVPLITLQPTNRAVCGNPSVSFSVGVSASFTPTYQWRKNGVNLANGPTGNGSTISGATTATLTINPATAGDAADALSGYDCVVSAPCETNSARVGLTVTPAPTLFALTGGGTICSGGSVTLVLSGSQIGADYRLRTNGVFNGVLVAGTGSPLIFPNLTVGGTYSVLASNSPGGCTAVMSGSPVVTIVAPPSITTGPTPAGKTNLVGDTATFTVAATGSGLTYQWYRDATPLVNGGNVSGATTPTLTVSPTAVTDTVPAGHGYHCVVNGSCGAAVVSGEALLTVLPVAALSEVSNGSWTNRYGGIGRAEDEAAKVVLDASGNVFVTGTSDDFISGKDFITIKYSSNGVPLWTRRYNGPGNRDDVAKGLALDGNGDVLVAGYSYNGTNDDYYTAKYAGADGALLWERRYAGPGNSTDQAAGLAVDGAGNALVTGLSSSTNCTVKYAAADGTLLWERRATGSNEWRATPVAVAVDTNGNVLVTGPVWNGADYDFYTVMYAAADGAIMWEGANYLPTGDQVPTALTLDVNGNVWVAGRSGPSSLSDSYVVKYAAANGAVLYGEAFHGPGSSSTGLRYDTATAIAAGPGGEVAVASIVTGSFASYYWTTRYPGSGSYWRQSYIATPEIYDKPSAVSVDVSGNIIVSGYSRSGNNDYLTVKYATNGVVLWARRYNGQANSADFAVSTAVDASGDVVVTGTSCSTVDTSFGRDFYTAKYAAADGALLWEQRYDGPGKLDDAARCVAVDGNGNVLAAGVSTRSSGNRTTDFYTAKYTPNGALVWEERFGGTNVNGDDLVGLVLDSSGNAIVAGTSGNDYYTAKYAAADGAPLWERRYNGPANNVDEVHGLAVDDSGNVIVTGRSSNGSNDDYYTAKYAAADGALVWEKRFNSNSTDVAESVVADTSGNAIVTGYSLMGANYDFYTAKYAAADGALLWEKRYNGPANNNDYAKAVALDGDGNVIVTGRSSNGSNEDYHTLKYAAADGALLWERRYNSSGSFNDQPSTVVVDSAGNAIVTGVAQGGACYTAKYAAADGALIWEQRIANPSANYPFALALDADANVVLAAPVPTSGKPDYYVAKYAAATGAMLWEKRYNGPVNGNDLTYTRSALAVGPWGQVVVAGGSDGTTNASGVGNLDFVTIQYATLGFELYPSAVVTGGTIDFAPRGGRPPLQFALTVNNSGGSIDPNTGLYTAGSQCGVTDTITLTDADLVSVTAAVRVAAPTPPSIVCPANIIVPAGLPCSAGATYSVTATDGCGLSLAPIVSPLSGSQFPVGTTTVYCTAVDDLGRTANCSFTVTVQSASPSCTPMPSGLVGFWRGENNALDTIGTNHGMLNGAVDFNACGVGGAGFNFNSLGGYVAVPFSPTVQQTNITVEAWIFAQGAPTTQAGILGTWNDLGGAGTAWRRTFLIWSYQGKLEFLCGAGGTIDRATDPAALPLNTWVHVAGTYDGSTIRLYRNGAQVASKAYSGILNTNDQPFYIGRIDAGGDGSDFWRGMIDDVSVYGRALSASEIAAIYAAGSAGKCLQAPALVIAPVSTNVVAGGAVNFSATGGQPPYQFSIAMNNSGGVIDPNTGAYTAGVTPGMDTVSLSDAVGSNALATVVVSASNTRPMVANLIPDTNGVYGTPLNFAFVADTFTDPDAGQTLSYAASGLPPGISFTPATRSFSGTPTNVGTFSVNITVTDNGSPTLSTNDTFDIVIAKAPLIGTADNKSRGYGQPNPALTFGYSGFVLGETSAVLDTPPVPGTTATAPSPIGPYPITLSGGADDHYEFSYVGGTLNITPALLTVSANSTNRLFGQANPPLAGSLVGLVNGDNITVTFGTTADPSSPPGDYPIKPILSDPDGKLGNYAVTTNNGTLTVNAPAELQVELPPGTNLAAGAAIYFGSMMSRYVDPTTQVQAPDGTFTVTFTGIFPNVYASYAIQTADNPPGPWSQLPAPGLAPDAGGTIQFHDPTPHAVAYYRLRIDTDTHRVFTIRNTGTNDLAAIVVTVTGTNPAPFELDLTGTATSLLPNASTTFSITYVAFDTNARTAELRIDANIPSPFVLTLMGGDVSPPNLAPMVANPIADTNGIYGTPLSVAFPANTFSDPDAGQILTYSATGLPAEITFTPATRTFSGTPTNVGPISVTVTATDNGSPALSTNDVFDIVIAKAPLTATADNQSRTYAESNPSLTFGYSSFVLGENASVLDTPPASATTATNGSPVGPYPITLAGGSDDHYEFSYVGGTLKVTPASLTVTAFDTNRVYGAANPPLDGSLAGIAWGDNITATFVTTATIADPPGAYAISPVLSDPDGKLGNYAVTTNSGTLTIVSPPELSISNGGGSLTLSWSASYGGFVLEYAVGLTPPIDWQPVTSGITESGGIKSYTVTPDPNVEGRLYRLRLP